MADCTENREVRLIVTLFLCVQLYVRRHYFFPPSRITQYYEDVTSQVRAETQVGLARLHASVI